MSLTLGGSGAVLGLEQMRWSEEAFLHVQKRGLGLTTPPRLYIVCTKRKVDFKRFLRGFVTVFGLFLMNGLI